jgi:tripartite ATP-independent transporter DctP family solute receptor
MSKKIFVILILFLFSIICVGDVVAEGATENPEFIFKFGHDQPENYPYHAYALAFAKEVDERTNGRVKIDIFPGAQLGSEATMTDSLRMGTLDFQISTSGNSSALLPRLGLVGMPFMYQGGEHISRVANDNDILEYYQEIVKNADVGVELLCFAASGPRNVFSTKPVNSIDDLKGLKIRCQSSPIEVEVWTAIGAIPTSMPYSEIYTALQTNLISSAESNPTAYVINKHNEVAKYYANTEHTWMCHPILASSKTLEKVDEKTRASFYEAARAARQVIFEEQAKSDASYLQEAIASGTTYNDNFDRQPLIEIVIPIQERIAEELDTVKALEMIRALR